MKGQLDTSLEAAAGAAFGIEVEQNLHVRVCDSAAIGPARQRREDGFRAACFVGGLVRVTNEDTAIALR